MPLMPSQQSSLSRTRTKLMCQLAIAATEASSVGPSEIPKPCTHAYSVPERLTPRRLTRLPLSSMRLRPDTCSPEGLAPAAEPANHPPMQHSTAAVTNDRANRVLRFIRPGLSGHGRQKSSRDRPPSVSGHARDVVGYGRDLGARELARE